MLTDDLQTSCSWRPVARRAGRQLGQRPSPPTADPKDIYNLTTGACAGTFLTTPDGKTRGSGHCLRKDKDGDTESIEWALAPGADKGTWRSTGGTGKFAGVSDSGWWQGAVADGKMVVTSWGGTCK